MLKLLHFLQYKISMQDLIFYVKINKHIHLHMHICFGY